MDELELADVFSKQKKKLDAVASYHKRKKQLYETKLSSPTLGVSIDEKWDKKFDSVLEWPRIAIDNLWAHTRWDAFKNDTFGATRLLVECNIDAVASSAIKQSMIGSCAFVTALPGGDGDTPVVYTPYTGSEATGVFNSSTGDLDFALVKYRYSSSNRVLEYLLFAPGVVYKINSDGDVLDEVRLLTDKIAVIPFVYDQDLASDPFGRSRLNRGMKSALDSAQRTLKRIEIASEFYAMPNYFLFMNGNAADVEKTEMVSKWGRLQTIFNEQIGAESPKVQTLGGNSPKDLIDQFKMYATNYAAAASMSSAPYGVEPSNGSYSYGTAQMNELPYNLILETCKSSHGRSIQKLALLSYELLGITVTSDMRSMTSEWVEQPKLELGKIGDAFVKFDINPDAIGFDVNDFVRKQLAIPLRDSAMNQSLPSITNAVKLSKAMDDFKTKAFDENGRLIINDKNSPIGG